MNTSNTRTVFLRRFPEKREFVDCAGKKRVFIFSCFGSDQDGYRSIGREETTSHGGYEFRGYSDTNPVSAFSDVVIKIREAMSQKFLDPLSEKPSLINCMAKGRVGSGGVVIDGRFVSFEELSELIQTHEGWDFSISFLS